MSDSKKIVFNTVITYSRVLVTAFISFYITRLLLEGLGASDFGLFNLIAGVVSLLAFLNSAMSTSTQRFLSFSLGKGDYNEVKKVFANSTLIHFVLGLFVVLLIEIVGVYLIEYKLDIGSDRVSIAKNLLHFATVSTFLTVISVPYDALINSYERMSFLALVSILESILKLIGTVVVFYVSNEDRLLYYGVFIMTISLLIRLIKRRYVRRNFKESHVSIMSLYNLGQIKELSAFASWSLFGVLCYLGRNQGVAVILNFFYSTVVNAAYGIANQINGQLMFFSQTLMAAVRPQIMKSEGANSRERMISLSLSANKFCFFLFTFFALPLYFQLPFILKLWLNDVPQYTVDFCRAILLLTMASQINQGVITAVQAIGKIKVYQTIAGGIQLLTLPIGYIFLSLGYPPQSVLIVSFFLECCSTVFRIFYFHYLTGYSVSKYVSKVILRCVLSLIPMVLFLSQIFRFNIINPWQELFITIFSVLVMYSIMVYFIGFDSNERVFFQSFLQKSINKLKNNVV